MNAIDTNVLIYRVDRQDPEKQAKARALLKTLRAAPVPSVLPWQVLGEFVRHLRFWQDRNRITRAALLRYTEAVRKLFPIAMPNPQVLEHVLDLTGRFRLSHWDSMLLGACIEAGITTLYTEDMGAPTTIGGIRLVNPFQ
jgi:predicted nucleic acid-binding protein